MAALLGKVEVLERLWDWAKEIELNSEEINNDVYLLKARMEKRPGTWQQQEASLNYYKNCGIGLKNYR